MLTEKEQDARRSLNYCKACAKDALKALDPAPAEPIAKAILALIDAADEAGKALAERLEAR